MKENGVNNEMKVKINGVKIMKIIENNVVIENGGISENSEKMCNKAASKSRQNTKAKRRQ
jgi:hypothetical protein